MHLSHEILYVLVAFLAGIILGMVLGIGLLVAWLKGWIFPVSVPNHLIRNDLGRPEPLQAELPLAGLPGE